MSNRQTTIEKLKQRGLIEKDDYTELLKNIEVHQEEEIKIVKNDLSGYSDNLELCF